MNLRKGIKIFIQFSVLLSITIAYWIVKLNNPELTETQVFLKLGFILYLFGFLAVYHLVLFLLFYYDKITIETAIKYSIIDRLNT